MVDFSNVAKHKVTEQSLADYELYDIDMAGATLKVAPATRSNTAYNRDLIKMVVPQQRRVQGGKISAEFLDKYRRDLTPIYARSVVRGWKNIVDSDGNVVEFTTQNVEAFLTALPSQSFDSLIEFCENEGNFREVADEDLAKN